MYTSKANTYDNLVATGADFLDRAVNFIDKVQSSKILKVIGYTVSAVAGLIALGGIFRVLAWTTAGAKQFTAVLHGK